MADAGLPRKKKATPSEADELRRHAEELLEELSSAAASPVPEDIAAAVHELRVHQIELEMQNEELRRAHLELDEQRMKYFDLFDLAPVGYLTLNDEGIVRDANLTAAHLLGMERQLLVGQPLSALVFAADRDAYYLHTRKLEKTGEPQACELRLRRLDGGAGGGAPDPFWALLESRSRRSSDDETLLTCVTLADITERKQAEAEILRLNADLEERVQTRTEELSSANEKLTHTNLRLEEATRAKSEFLAAMSHELRTPLNSIIGFSGTLSQGLAGDLNQEQGRQIAMINNSGRHLLELINEVLDLARIEAGRRKPGLRRTDIRAVVRQTFETVRPMADAKGIEMRLTCPDGLTRVRTDELCVNQILLNLLGNAVKFTEQGCVGATVSNNGSGVMVAVEDTGCGIAAEDLERVFDDFYQATPPEGGKSDGTGLGLAVSRRLADSIGARIEVTSEPDRGSVFTLHIPDRSR